MSRAVRAGVAAVVAVLAAWAVYAAWQTVAAVGSGAWRAAWLLPGLMALNSLQLLLSSRAWRRLVIPPVPGRAVFFRLRLVREGIDSLLPVAQVGGEIVGARLLAGRGVALPLAAASVVVDVTVEFLTQIVFLFAGLAVMSLLPGIDTSWQGWFGAAALAAIMAGALLIAQRCGVLRLVEALVRQIAARFPALADVPLEGLHAAALALYRRRGPMLGAAGLHLLAWMLGTFETWAVLRALGSPVGLAQALVIESLGMAARSAGFAIPGALVVQETGFVLAAAAMGVPQVDGLTLSVVKRVREVGVGLIGLAMWRR